MLSERAARCFSDILASVGLIETWVAEAGGPDAAILQNTLVRSGVERQLLIIIEAAIRLDKIEPEITPGLAPEIDWPGIRGIGNFIRHRYDDLDTQVILDVIENRLGQLKSACERALEAP